MSEFKLEKRKAIELIAEINRGEIQLPQFQRDYKWKPSAVAKLLDSLNKLHPAGSLLFLEVDNSKETIITYEKVRSAPESANNAKPLYLILDGQQRLTSCHSVLTNSVTSTGNKTYFIDLKMLMSKYKGDKDAIDLVEDKIIVIKNHIKQPDSLLYSRNLLPFTYLIKLEDPSKSKEELRKKLYGYKENIRNDEKGDKDLLKFVETELENFLDAFFDYQFPTIILPKTLDITGVCKVFQSINTTGLKLSAFDICVATFTSYNINLKEMLQEVKANYPSTKIMLEDDETIILQTIALLSGVSPKKNSLPANLKKGHIDDYWTSAAKCLDLCASSLENFGVGITSGTDLVPYQPIIPVIAATLAKTNYPGLNHGEQAHAANKIKKWFFTVCISLRYTEGTDNKMKDDYNALCNWISLNQEPEILKEEIPWYPQKVITANKNGAFGKAIMVAINSKKPQDFYTSTDVGFGEKISVNCQNHHIFPQAKYKKKHQKLVDSVFNFTFLTAKSNVYIKDKRTNEYINDIYTETDITPLAFAEKLQKHFIDNRCLDHLEKEDFENFLLDRAENVFNHFKDNIGIKLRLAATQVNDEDYVDTDDDYVDDQDEA